MTEPPVWMGPPGDEEPQLPSEPTGGAVAAMVVAGVLSFGPLAFLLDSLIFAARGTNDGQILLATATAGVAFGVGGALCFIRSRLWRGFGIGLMIGWALLSIVSGGLCTGLTGYP